MAIEFIRSSIHTRSKGHSAVAGAAYRAGVKLLDERTGEVHDFSNRHDIAYQNIMLPDGADERLKDRETLWNAVEAIEKRKDAQVTKDFVLALPREISLGQQMQLARQFAYDHFVKHGLAVDVAIHEHSDGNPHAHLYVTTRRVIGKALDKYKARDLNPTFANSATGKGFISEQDHWNKQWRDYQNIYFEREGLTLLVDENHLIRQRHSGRIAKERSYIQAENQNRRDLSVELTLTSPETLLNELSSKLSVFSSVQIERLISKNTDTPEQKQMAQAGLYAHKDLIPLGPGDDGRERYTTRANYELEAELGDRADALLLQDKKVNLSAESLNKYIVSYQLNSDQADALYHVMTSRGISAIVGRAGTGKSYLMRAAGEIWKQQGLTVIGMAPSAVAAKGLKRSADIPSRTMAYYQQLIAHDAWHLDKNTVVVIDEAGMADLSVMADIIRHVHQAGAQLVLVGDHGQLQPVGPGAPFRALLERIGFAEMDQVMRQKDIGDRQATVNLSKGHIAKAIVHYEHQKQIHIANTAIDAQADLLRDWESAFKSHGNLANQLILAHRNVEVTSLNELVRHRLIELQDLGGAARSVESNRGSLELRMGERLLFLQNDKALGIANGDFATLLSLDKDMLTVKLDDNNKKISFSMADYNHFTHGYAATVHKTQGVTLDNVFVYVGNSGWDRNLTYVALSRHRESVNLYANKSQFKNIAHLSQVLSREQVKDTVLDYPLSFALRRGLDPESLAGRMVERVSQLHANIQDKWLFVTNYEAYLARKERRASQISIQQRRQEARKVAEFVDLHRSCGQQWSSFIKHKPFDEPQKKAYYQSEGYRNLLDLTIEKNRLAFELTKDLNRYTKAILANHINSEVVIKAAEQYRLAMTAKAYLSAYQARQSLTLQRLSVEIVENPTAFYGALANQISLQVSSLSDPLNSFEGLTVSQLLESAKTESLKWHYYQTKRTLTSSEAKRRLEATYQYATLDQQLRGRWKMIYAHGGVEKLSQAQLQQTKLLSNRLDELGFELYKDFAGHDKEITLFSIDRDKLKQNYDRHVLRKEVIDYSQRVKNITREQLATELLTDRQYYRFIYEQEVSWQQLYHDKHDYERHIKLLTLSPVDRKAYQHLRSYQQARITTARAFAALIEDKKQNMNVYLPIGREKLCWNLLNTRNRLAYQIALNPALYTQHLTGLKIKLDDLEKHALSYQKQLSKDYATKAKIKAAKAKSAKNEIINNEHDTDKVLVKQHYSKSYDSVSYLDVSEALQAMGETFYERVLGFEGKREGVNHIRYGNGHALTFAHSGPHAGSWHSFSSGEGGGPIQLLMSRHHGLGLDFKEAIKEGARIAGISTDRITALQPSVQPVKPIKPTITAEQNSDINLEDKIKAASYYYESAKPIAGTLGERYLREHRHIVGPISSIRFHDKIKEVSYKANSQEPYTAYYPGIVVVAYNEQGKLTGSQTIILDPKTGNKIAKDQVEVVKRSRGVIKGSAVCIQTGSSNQVILAEGIETALSLTTAAPEANIYVTLGNIKNAESLTWLAQKHNTKEIYFAADYDPHTEHKNIAIIKEMAKVFKHEHNIDTYYSQPILEDNAQKCDFNDILKYKGVAHTKDQLNDWKKVIVPEREKLISSNEIQNNVKSLDKNNQGLKEPSQEEKINAIIKHYVSLLEKQKNVKVVSEYDQLQEKLDSLAVSIYQNKELRNAVQQKSTTLFDVLKARAEKVLSRDKDIDLER